MYLYTNSTTKFIIINSLGGANKQDVLLAANLTFVLESFGKSTIVVDCLLEVTLNSKMNLNEPLSVVFTFSNKNCKQKFVKQISVQLLQIALMMRL